MFTVTKSFANLDAFRRHLDETQNNTAVFGSYYESEKGTRSFTGTGSFVDADGLLRDGDTENARKLNAAAGNGLKSANGDGARVRRFSAVCGGVANVPATVLGLPKSMIQTRKIVYKDSKVLNLIYNTSIDWTVGADEITKVSATLVCAIMGLEKKGYRVNLFVNMSVYEGTGRNKETVAAFVRIKDSGQYLDAKKMAYPLVNPSMLRRHFFKFIEKAAGISNSRWPDGYGHPIKDAAEVAELAKGAGVRSGRVVSFYDIRRMSAPEIMQFVLS